MPGDHLTDEATNKTTITTDQPRQKQEEPTPDLPISRPTNKTTTTTKLPYLAQFRKKGESQLQSPENHKR